MAGEWETVALDSLIEPNRGISYGIVQPGAPVADGVPIVRVSDVRDGRVVISAPLRVAPAIEAAYARTRLSGGELLLTLVGTVGEAAVVPASLAGWNTARAVAVIPVRKDVGAYWVQLALRAPGVRAIIDSRLNTTVQATLNLGDVAQLPIVLPPIREREAIAHILGTLDDKIELNRRMNETLNAFCRTLFSRVTTGAVTAPLGNLAEINGRKRDRTYPHDLIEYVEISGVGRGCIEKGARHPTRLAPGRAQRLVRDGDTIWSCVRPNRRSYAFIDSPPDDLVVSTGFATLTPRSVPPAYLYFASTADGFVDHLTANADGSAYPAVKPEHFAMGEIPLASGGEISAFEAVARPALARSAHNDRESRTLAALRDALLPKLISGELRVTEGARRHESGIA